MNRQIKGRHTNELASALAQRDRLLEAGQFEESLLRSSVLLAGKGGGLACTESTAESLFNCSAAAFLGPVFFRVFSGPGREWMAIMQSPTEVGRVGRALPWPIHADRTTACLHGATNSLPASNVVSCGGRSQRVFSSRHKGYKARLSII